MSVLELTRDVGDKRRFVLSSVGTVTRGKFWNDPTALEAPGHPVWQATNTKVIKPVYVAADPERVERARFELNRAKVTVGERSLSLERTPAGWTTKPGDYRLVEDGRDLVSFGPRKWGRRPITVTVHEEGLLAEPVLLLFLTFAAGTYAEKDLTRAGAVAFG